jgi:hypothetical protein
MVRLANVGRALLMAAWIDAGNAWMSGVHPRGLVIWGCATFLAGLAVFEGGERWDRRRQAAAQGPPPPLATGEQPREQPRGAEGREGDGDG